MPDRSAVDVERLRGPLAARWARIETVAETPSTNAALLADTGAPDRSVLVAEHQVAGRGRFDRTWTSPPGAGLTFSVLLRPGVPLARLGWLPLLAGVALHEAVRGTTGVDAVLKWPNDLLAAGTGGKLAGILAQTADDAVVVGIGLNVSTTAAELPTETATSLELCGARTVDRTDLLAAILRRLDVRCAQWVDVDGDAAACGLAADYGKVCATLGQSVRVTLGGGAAGAGPVVQGLASAVDPVGRLIVRTAQGEQAVSAGDVEHVRPA
ncbi:MAG TPA: biotin--[acetyl-CoA-carboxylase] ligase [Jatrophihabitans sp.]|jgi:BirA family biotin operon repressor/biotin-[acetyl-CoA-carboxylase] ligase|nr:biotin--[acetyl-CoA-carboxylase] ligase [Jatrophihabitans sp.]